MKPDLKHLGLYEPLILVFVLNLLYVRARLALRLGQNDDFISILGLA